MEKVSQKSEFTGNFWGMFGTSFVCALISIFSLTIATPWAICKFIRWKTEHTVINGQQLKFEGSGGQLFGKILVWFLLSIITIGIYAFIAPIKFMRWKTENTAFVQPVRFGGFTSSQPVQPKPQTTVAATSTTPSPAPATPVGNTTGVKPTTQPTSNLGAPKTPVSNLSSANGVRTTAPATPNGQGPRPVQPTLAGPRPVQPGAQPNGVQPRPVSPLTQAPAPRPAPTPMVTPKKTAGLGAAIFALIFCIIGVVILALAFILQFMPVLLESIPLPEVITTLNLSYIYYASAGVSALGLLLSFIGIGKYSKEKKRSGAKPVATLIFSIFALLDCLVVLLVSLALGIPMLYEFVAPYIEPLLSSL